LAGKKLLLSVPPDLLKWIDKWVSEINSKKQSWQRPSNRQALVLSCIKFAMNRDAKFTSRYRREVQSELPKS